MDLRKNTTNTLEKYIPEDWQTRLNLISAAVGIPASIVTIGGLVSNIAIQYWIISVGVLITTMSFYFGTRYATYHMSLRKVSIIGCIKKDQILWKASLYTKNEKWDSIEIEQNPMCPDCRTHLQAEWFESSYQSGVRGENRRALAKATGTHERRRIWRCPECLKQYPRSEREDELMTKIFDKHFSKIYKSQDQSYSIDILRSDWQRDKGEQPSAEQIWSKYADVVDDSNISTDCFF